LHPAHLVHLKPLQKGDVMGTLFDQPARINSLASIAEWVCLTGTDLGFNMKTPDGVRAACDIIRTALMIQNADVLDEQLGGLGSLLLDYIEREQS